MHALKKLFEPIRIGSLTLANRIIMPAITTRYDLDDDGQWAAFFAARARGGAGLIVIGALQAIFPGRRQTPTTANINQDSHIPRLKKVTDAIHSAGSKAAALLATYDYWSKDGIDSTPEDIGPSEVVIPRDGILPRLMAADYLPRVRALTSDEINQIQAEVVAAAGRAQQAGFDAVEIQMVGGNLLNRFINPFTNRRTDRYGGRTENRARIVREIITGIKSRLGKGFPLICRVSGDDMVPWGEGLEYWKQVAALLEKAGADAVTVMPGWHESRAPRNQMCVPNDHFVYLAAGIKEAVNIPVAAGNNITDPLLAESIIASGRADFIAMGRPLIADPELPMKAKEGRFSEIRRCTRCCFCYECFPKGIPLACSVNPFVGREKAGPVVPAEKKKKVVVIGGGPAGMQAALTASERGHKVVLYEQSVRLGGQVIRAAVPPHKSEWLNLVKYLESELARKRVRTVLRSKVTADIIKKEGPDAVIIATGAVPFVPAIDGTGGKNVDGALDILDGKRRAGKQVVVIGGGSVGLETAEFLAVAGKKVIILEALARVGEDVGEHNRWVLIDRLVELGVRMETLSPVIEITDKGVWTGVNGLRYLFYEADTVVTATGMKPYNTLAGQLKGEVPLVKVIGDCLKPRKIKEAVEEGYLAGIEV